MEVRKYRRNVVLNTLENKELIPIRTFHTSNLNSILLLVGWKQWQLITLWYWLFRKINFLALRECWLETSVHQRNAPLGYHGGITMYTMQNLEAETFSVTKPLQAVPVLLITPIKFPGVADV